MDIAKLSTALASQKVQHNANLLLAKKVMNLTEASGEQLLDMLSTSVAPDAPHPTSGATIDIQV